MAFPVTANPTITSNGTASTSHSINLPSSIVSGDLIVLGVSVRDGSTSISVTGFTSLGSQSQTGVGADFLYRICDGTEGSTVSCTLGASRELCAHAYKVGQWLGTSAGIEISTITGNGSGTSADPASLTASWGAADNLWFAFVMAGNEGEIITGFPTGFTGTTSTNTGTDVNNECEIGSCRKEDASATVDPSAFTIANTEGHVQATLVVRPGTSGGGSTGQTASGTITAQSASLSGAAIRTVVSTGTLASQASSLSSTAVRTVIATSTLLVGAASLSGNATVTNGKEATGTLIAGVATLSGVAGRTVLVNGTLASSAADLVGFVGEIAITEPGRIRFMRTIRIS